MNDYRCPTRHIGFFLHAKTPLNVQRALLLAGLPSPACLCIPVTDPEVIDSLAVRSDYFDEFDDDRSLVGGVVKLADNHSRAHLIRRSPHEESDSDEFELGWKWGSLELVYRDEPAPFSIDSALLEDPDALAKSFLAADAVRVAAWREADVAEKASYEAYVKIESQLLGRRRQEAEAELRRAASILYDEVDVPRVQRAQVEVATAELSAILKAGTWAEWEYDLAHVSPGQIRQSTERLRRILDAVAEAQAAVRIRDQYLEEDVRWARDHPKALPHDVLAAIELGQHQRVAGRIRRARRGFERPGWVARDALPGRHVAYQGAAKEAFALLERARQVDAEADLRFWQGPSFEGPVALSRWRNTELILGYPVDVARGES